MSHRVLCPSVGGTRVPQSLPLSCQFCLPKIRMSQADIFKVCKLLHGSPTSIRGHQALHSMTKQSQRLSRRSRSIGKSFHFSAMTFFLTSVKSTTFLGWHIRSNKYMASPIAMPRSTLCRFHVSLRAVRLPIVMNSTPSTNCGRLVSFRIQPRLPVTLTLSGRQRIGLPFMTSL
jgi:hypothetical protein